MNSTEKALAPLFPNKQTVVARLSPHAIKETILYLKTEISGIKTLLSGRNVLIRKTKADGKSVAHLERANKRAEKELTSFEAKLADFEKRRADIKKAAPSSAPAPVKAKRPPAPANMPTKPARRSAKR